MVTLLPKRQMGVGGRLVPIAWLASRGTVSVFGVSLGRCPRPPTTGAASGNRGSKIIQTGLEREARRPGAGQRSTSSGGPGNFVQRQALTLAGASRAPGAPLGAQISNRSSNPSPAQRSEPQSEPQLSARAPAQGSKPHLSPSRTPGASTEPKPESQSNTRSPDPEPQWEPQPSAAGQQRSQEPTAS